ncbi:MAG: nuclear transport factor 2 family protein [Acidimicrobiales bacterium]
MTSSEVVVEVMQAISRYADAVDTRDLDAVVPLLAEGVRLTRGDEEFEGIDEFIEAYRPAFEVPLLAARHMVSNVIVDQTAPREVSVTARFHALMFTDAMTRHIYGSYQDNLVKVDGEWLFQHKRNHLEWAIEGPPATAL